VGVDVTTTRLDTRNICFAMNQNQFSYKTYLMWSEFYTLTIFILIERNVKF
jgi:hypothetical protein